MAYPAHGGSGGPCFLGWGGAAFCALTVLACTGEPGPAGLNGAPGDKGDPGEPGQPGAAGLGCWDLNENGACDLVEEDVDQDGKCSPLDCQGHGAGGGGAGGGVAGLGYVGSESCKLCHESEYELVSNSGHPYKLTKVEGDKAPSRPFDATTGGVPAPPLGLKWSDIGYVVGGFGWKVRYVGQDGYLVTGGADDKTQWNFPNETIGTQGSWAAYKPGEKVPYDCGGCHTTGWVPCAVGDDTCAHQDGLEGMAGSFAEAGVRCEACHGPGSLHGAQPYLVDAKVDRSPEACGKCHRRDAVEQIEAKGGFVDHHEQWDELFQSKKHVMRCIDCHDPHQSSKFAHPGLNPDKGIRVACISCHVGYDANQKSKLMANLDCVACHMPRLVKSAAAVPAKHTGDIRSHMFAINPDAAAPQFSEDGKQARPYLTLPWACNHCHGIFADDKPLGELAAMAKGYHAQ
ncbi:MAG: hypothetical protein HY744_16545 [Deltaproteobacteria bacterium]|nr:hypothetical protein [Deltaproteobacteria bacterium]